MKLKALCLLLLALVASAALQSVDEIPEENDNQFPPDNAETGRNGDEIEGSGAGTIEEPLDVTENNGSNSESSPPPLLEDVQSPESEDILPNAAVAETGPQDDSCPKPCVCHIEGETNNFVVDCSGYDLTEFPAPIDPKTTTLNVQKNKLTEIPKDISSLKNLKVLNADSNSIMDLASGSISELPELTILKLGNNRLIDYPQDLKNGFSLTKLEELDLGGNDMRTSLNRDIFSHFTALKKLTLPSGAKDLVQDLCTSMKKSLVTVCTESCGTDTFECPEAPQDIEDDLFSYILPGTIALTSFYSDNTNPAAAAKTNTDKILATETSGIESGAVKPPAPDSNTDSDFSLRSAVNKAPETPKGESSNDQKEAEVGATTSENKKGGVNKSVIAIIAAGMVLVVAGITIKKNWSSIRNRFSSAPRPANERPGANANGTAPEEVPLQEKSPV